jgi:hypothetical protein
VLAFRSGIEIELTRHKGLWTEEAVCDVLLLDEERSAYRFSVALESGAAEEGADATRRRLEAELGRDLEVALPDALGVQFHEGTAPRRPRRRGRASKPLSVRDLMALFAAQLPDLRKLLETRHGPQAFRWRDDAIRRLGYFSLSPHGLARLGSEPEEPGPERWRRTLR